MALEMWRQVYNTVKDAQFAGATFRHALAPAPRGGVSPLGTVTGLKYASQANMMSDTIREGRPNRPDDFFIKANMQ